MFRCFNKHDNYYIRKTSLVHAGKKFDLFREMVVYTHYNIYLRSSTYILFPTQASYVFLTKEKVDHAIVKSLPVVDIVVSSLFLFSCWLIGAFKASLFANPNEFIVVVPS